MMCVDAADRTEIMLGGHGIELIERQFLGAFQDSKATQGNRCHHGPAPATEGAIATPDLVKAVGQVQLELNSPAMTRGAMDRFNVHAGYNVLSAAGRLWPIGRNRWVDIPDKKKPHAYSVFDLKA